MYSSYAPSYRRKLERAARRLNAKQFARLKALGATLHINAYVHNRRPRKGQLRLSAHLYFDLPLKESGVVIQRGIADVALLMPGYVCAKDPARRGERRYCQAALPPPLCSGG